MVSGKECLSHTTGHADHLTVLWHQLPDDQGHDRIQSENYLRGTGDGARTVYHFRIGGRFELVKLLSVEGHRTPTRRTICR